MLHVHQLGFLNSGSARHFSQALALLFFRGGGPVCVHATLAALPIHRGTYSRYTVRTFHRADLTMTNSEWYYPGHVTAQAVTYVPSLVSWSLKVLSSLIIPFLISSHLASTLLCCGLSPHSG